MLFNTSAKSFDIRNFTDCLTKTKRGRYICPNCNQPKLGIARSGKYQCWSCYDTKKIASLLTEPEHEEQRRRRELERQTASKTQKERVAEWIKGSGVAPEITAKNIRHIDHAPAIAQLLNWNWYSHTGGWYVSSC